MQIAPFRAAREAFLTWQWVPGIEKAALLHQVAAGIRSKHQVNFTIKEPYGVVAALIPWNSRCCVSHGKSRAELAARNTVIIKPSEETALATSALAEILVGLPTA